jgi:S-adenosyl methyltransferase
VTDTPENTNDALAARIRYDVPHSARIWNYWMGGKDNYEVDRQAGDAWIALDPDVVNEAKQSRQFLIRAVSFLAGEAGIRQFLDIGTGLPTMQNTHEVAQGVAPESRIVYVDNDPLVLAHARALLTNTTPEGVTSYIYTDYHDPEDIVSQARNILNFTIPITVMFMGVLGHEPDFDAARSIVTRVMDAVPSGSYLVLWDSSNESERAVRAMEQYNSGGAVPYIQRPPELIRRFFNGFQLLEPGFVPISLWRPNGVDIGEIKPTYSYGAVALKP